MVFAIQMGITGAFHQPQVIATNRPHVCARTLWLELREAPGAGEVMDRVEPGFWKKRVVWRVVFGGEEMAGT